MMHHIQTQMEKHGFLLDIMAVWDGGGYYAYLSNREADVLAFDIRGHLVSEVSKYIDAVRKILDLPIILAGHGATIIGAMDALEYKLSKLLPLSYYLLKERLELETEVLALFDNPKVSMPLDKMLKIPDAVLERIALFEGSVKAWDDGKAKAAALTGIS